MKTREEYTIEIRKLIAEYAELVDKDPLCIGNKEMFTLSNLFYLRDWRVETDGHSAEGLAFQRGVQTGMMLYREISNPKQPEYMPL